ncbi:receptor protein kinase-like protein ZAR1 [Silene latifolia]|uniref:receptor protein kinase-like protein ZAR1 n=1 Tax=Silene latifolia TaxID=37657 RepID=UPI003D776C4A
MSPSFVLPFLTLLLLPLTIALNSDGLALLALKSAITHDPTHSLSTWSISDLLPCRWYGVHCTRNRVTYLSLSNLSLSGYVPSELGALDSLTHLSLSSNNFTSTIPPHLFNATSLVALDLSHNSLSGPLPSQISALKDLTFLDLSDNLLNDSLPTGLSQLTRLQGTLNLSYNEFSGVVPASYGDFPVMVSLDLRHNNLSGKIPQVGSLLNQGPTAFAGNPGLCGFPLSNPCLVETLNPNFQNPENPISPRNPNAGVGGDTGKKPGSVPLVVGVFVVVAVVVVCGVILVILWVRVRRKYLGVSKGKMGKEGEVVSHVRVVVGENLKIEEEEEGQKGKFVVIDEEGFGLELEDLLRASAYVVGKSRSGIVYRVVAGGGGKGSSSLVPPMLVAVRRLSEADEAMWRYREFEAEVEAIGKVQHPNIVRLRAYYYARDEKLLVSDFIRNGSLYSSLHGGPSNDVPPLSWASRLKIAQGAARGLMHIHEQAPKKYIHGNIKSSKILLDDDLHSYISGFGLTRLLGGTFKSANPHSRRPSLSHSLLVGSKILGPSYSAYSAPEAQSGGKLTQKCDVYSFGIVLMEMLTGQLPVAGPDNGGAGLESLVRKVFREERPLSEIIDPALLHEVSAKKQVLATFHIALNCTELDPELRPRMKTVSENLDRLKFQ